MPISFDGAGDEPFAGPGSIQYSTTDAVNAIPPWNSPGSSVHSSNSPDHGESSSNYDALNSPKNVPSSPYFDAAASPDDTSLPTSVRIGLRGLDIHQHHPDIRHPRRSIAVDHRHLALSLLAHQDTRQIHRRLLLLTLSQQDTRPQLLHVFFRSRRFIARSDLKLKCCESRTRSRSLEQTLRSLQ